MVYVGLGVGGAPIYLGTTVGKPHVEHQPRYVPVMNDLAGPAVRLTSMYAGAEALVQGTFSRYKQATYDAIRTYVGRGTPGIDAEGARGTLMQLEGQNYNLFLVFPFAFKTAMNPGGSDGNLEAGYHYPQAQLVAPDSFEPGMGPKELHLTWYCENEFTPSSKGGSFKLYDNTIPSLPAPD